MAIDLIANQTVAQRPASGALGQLTQQRQEAMQATLSALNLKAGDTVEALIRSVTPANDQLRARLSQWVFPSSQTGDSATARNATATGIQMKGDGTASTLTQLLRSPRLNLIEIQVRNQTLTLFTDQPVRRGQTLPLQWQEKGFVTQPSTPQTGRAYSAIATATPGTSPSAALSPPQMQTLNQVLRALLPIFHDPQAQAHKAVTDTLQVAQLLTQSRPDSATLPLRESLPRSVSEALRQVATHLRTPLQMTQPNALQNAIKNSGIFMEKQLSQPLNTTAPGTTSVPPAGDLKGALLTVLKALAATSSPGTPPTLTQWLNQLPANASVPMLLGALLKDMRREGGAGSDKGGALRPETIATQLQQQVQLALAKILFDQLRSLQKSQSSSESGSTTSLQLEIPIRYGSETYPLAVQVEEKWEQTQDEKRQRPAELTQKWLIKMTFELPTAGKLHAHISCLNDQVSTTLWAEKTSTFLQASAHLNTLRQRLEKDGCVVSTLECLPGKPQIEKTELNYSLVDVRT